ncbi:glutamate--cysteine ligase [Actinomycetospora atypica]|uniref:Glutamate--cysteine ligase n=1 Tax=Actinomycetospora atypica TaxID=1290095 RepID=A0ABV9YR11_9PSEU
MEPARSDHVPDGPSLIDQARFRERLDRCLTALRRMVAEGRLAGEEPSTGVELEVALVDTEMRPALRNEAVLESSDSEDLTSELGSWNLELNLPPRKLSEAAEGVLEEDIRTAVAGAEASARRVGVRAVTIGILPTLEARHLDSSRLTDDPRYTLLDSRLTEARGRPFHLDIAAPDGTEHLRMDVPSVAAEAACTSLQLHLQLAPDALGAHWNAAQAVAGVQLAMAANSPFLLGHRLWAETRIPLFTQAVDIRTDEERRQGVRPHVWFGDRWVESGLDLFAENVGHFGTLLPLAGPDEEDPLEALDRGLAPSLAELHTHDSTVWRWNRPVYGVADGVAHLRLENRVLPACPTAADAVADALFFYGLVRGLTRQDRPVWREMSFGTAEANFTAGAQHGIEATLSWPGSGSTGAPALVEETLLPVAEEGLASWGVDPAVVARHLGVIEQRCRTRRIGATWQLEVVADLERHGTDRREAMRRMLGLYAEGTASGEPVHTWSRP